MPGTSKQLPPAVIDEALKKLSLEDLGPDKGNAGLDQTIKAMCERLEMVKVAVKDVTRYQMWAYAELNRGMTVHTTKTATEIKITKAFIEDEAIHGSRIIPAFRSEDVCGHRIGGVDEDFYRIPIGIYIARQH